MSNGHRQDFCVDSLICDFSKYGQICECIRILSICININGRKVLVRVFHHR